MAKPTREEIIRLELGKLQDKHGRLTADIVIKAARNPKHSLHREFQWNQAKAAYSHWVDTANALIRYVTVVTIDKTTTVVTPYYVRDPEKPGGEQGMIAITSDLINRKNAEKIMLTELDRCQSAIERARAVVGVLDRGHRGLATRLEKALYDIIEMRADLAA